MKAKGINGGGCLDGKGVLAKEKNSCQRKGIARRLSVWKKKVN